MTDDEMPRKANDQSGGIKPEQVEQQQQQGEAAPMARQNRQAAPGRRPLFRN
jgi:hypothetical protein